MAQTTPTVKVILVGEYGVGKSSLFRRFVDNSFTEEMGPRSTVGLDHFSKKFSKDGKDVKFELWDTAGIERFATLSSSYFQKAHAAMLVYDVTNRETFSPLSQHILDAVMHSETAKLFLCGNKIDLLTDNSDEDDIVTESCIEEFCTQCDAMLSGRFKVSCKTNERVTDMFRYVADCLIKETIVKLDPNTIQPRHPLPPQPEQKCCS